MSTLFNRKDTTVIEFALNNSLEDFLKQYSTTSANADTLTKAYNEIVGNKTKANIAITSGDGKPDQPLTAINAEKPAYGLDKNGEIEVPKSLKLNKGKVVKTTPNPDPITTETTTVKPAKAVKAEKAPKAVASGEQPTISKRDAIRAFLQTEGNGSKTNREIKDAMIAQGYNSCYDSEISAVKSKL